MLSGHSSGHEGPAKALEYWRTLSAAAFDAMRRDEIDTCVRGIGATDPEWRAALDGDASAACALALRMFTGCISFKTDLIMTVLLRCAFVDGEAAVVFSDRLLRLPLDRAERMRLAVSWLLFGEDKNVTKEG